MSEPGHDHDAEAVAAAEGLTAALAGVREDLTALREELEATRRASELRDARLAKDAQRSKDIIKALAVSFVLDLIVTAGLGYNTVRVNDTQNAGRASEISACRQANVNRRQDIAIWNTFLNDIAPPSARAKTTPKIRAELAGIEHLIEAKDTPRNCVVLYASGP